MKVHAYMFNFKRLLKSMILPKRKTARHRQLPECATKKLNHLHVADVAEPHGQRRLVVDLGHGGLGAASLVVAAHHDVRHLERFHGELKHGHHGVVHVAHLELLKDTIIIRISDNARQVRNSGKLMDETKRVNHYPKVKYPGAFTVAQRHGQWLYFSHLPR